MIKRIIQEMSNKSKIVLYPAEGGGNDIPCFGILSEGIVDVYSHDEIKHNGNRYKCVPDWSNRVSSHPARVWCTRTGRVIEGTKVVNIDGRKYFYEEEGSKYDSSKEYIYTKYATDVY